MPILKAVQAASTSDTRVRRRYLHLGPPLLRQGDRAAAIATWERAIQVTPLTAELSLGSLENAAYMTSGSEHRCELCRIAHGCSPREWRARVALAKHVAGRGELSPRALELPVRGARAQPHALAIHQAIWGTLSRSTSQASGRALHRNHPRVGLLPRPARLPALPLPQHRAASGSARTVTSGTRSSRSASRRRPTPKPRFRRARPDERVSRWLTD
jgi:hypothetical protein